MGGQEPQTRIACGALDSNGYFQRMRGYLGEMFPIPRHAALALLAALGIAGFTRTVHGVAAPLGPGPVLAAAWNVFAMLLILRLMDEIKDEDIDRELFPERPLPSRRVRKSDIILSLAATITVYLVANAHSLTVLVSAVVVLGYALLMFKRFFAPQLLRRSLPVTLATHTPVIPLIWVQAFAVLTDAYHVPLANLLWCPIALYVVMLWLAVVSWEVARKIRPLQEETEYVTYSRLLGATAAIGVVATLQTAAMLIAASLYFQYGLRVPYLVLMAAGWTVCGWVYVRFLTAPAPRADTLKSAALSFIIAVLLAQVYGFVLAHP